MSARSPSSSTSMLIGVCCHTMLRYGGEPSLVPLVLSSARSAWSDQLTSCLPSSIEIAAPPLFICNVLHL